MEEIGTILQSYSTHHSQTDEKVKIVITKLVLEHQPLKSCTWKKNAVVNHMRSWKDRVSA